MTLVGWFEISIVLVAVGASAWPLSRFIAAVFAGRKTFLVPLENALYKLAGVDPANEQSWLSYALSMLVFSALCFFALYLIQRCQGFLPLNPLSQPSVAPDLAFNTAISFITNANWQAYAGETTMSHSRRWSASAVAIAMAVALIRAFVRREADAIGNFWVDLTRATLYVLLPLSIVVALVLTAIGIPQTLHGAVEASTLEGARQTISLGPVASQEAIKLLGNNGGGFFNANSAHPFENPSALSNMIENWSQLVLPTALVLAFGRMVGDRRQGTTLLAWLLRFSRPARAAVVDVFSPAAFKGAAVVVAGLLQASHAFTDLLAEEGGSRRLHGSRDRGWGRKKYNQGQECSH
jgi:potassium-transporting ATPase potassium-binding subunit